MKNSEIKIMLLGSGELGKEFAIAAQRLGLNVIAVDSYAGAPAMQVADEFEVIDMLNSTELGRIVSKHRPDIIVPEIEALRTEKLIDFEASGIQVVPTANATHLTMNRDAIRDVAAKKLKLKTASFLYAESFEELLAAPKSRLSECGKTRYVIFRQRTIRCEIRNGRKNSLELCRFRDARG